MNINNKQFINIQAVHLCSMQCCLLQSWNIMEPHIPDITIKSYVFQLSSQCCLPWQLLNLGMYNRCWIVSADKSLTGKKVNGQHLYCTFTVFPPLKALYMPHSHTHIHKLMGVQKMPCTGAWPSGDLIFHSKTDGTDIGSNLGFRIWAKDTLTGRLKELEINPPMVRLVDDWLYLLSYSCLPRWANGSDYGTWLNLF